MLSPLSWLSALIAACAVSAWALALGWPRRPSAPLYRPIAWLLTWQFASGFIRGAIQLLWTRPARVLLGPEPYPWPVVVAYHADEALHIAGPVALVAASLAVFVRRRPWTPILGAWAALATASALSYPALRLGARDTAHAALSGLAIAATAVCAWYSIERRRDIWRVEHMAMATLICSEVGVLVSTLAWDDPGAHWDIARRVQAAAYGLLLVGQAWYTSRRQ